ncbi:MAG: 2Fe-2S iron-sulfur cluster-binding protein, partial [Dehalococcoidales bacterium]|nr:2Fe-2S iron-sulfur cluster-binding protein [Dehalococcoidales bacterium]
MRTRIRILPSGQELRPRTGKDLRTALLEARIPLDSPCGGQGTCAKCKVRISGISQKFTGLEREKLSAEELSRGWRLACQVIIETPGDVHLSEIEPFQAKAGFGLLGEAIPLQPNVLRINFKLTRPTITDQRADWDRLARRLGPQEKNQVGAELSLLRELPDQLRAWDYRGEAVLVGNDVVALRPPDSASD